MPLDIPSFTKSLKSVFKQLQKSQAEALSIEIAANYTAGQIAAEKHKSSIQVTPQSIPSQYPVNTQSLTSEGEEDEGLTTEEKAEIAILVALFLGYLKKYNDTAQAQVLAEVKSMVQAGKTQEDIQDYVKGVFEGKESIVIDNVGKTKKELYVDKNLQISEVDKVIENPAFISVAVYASLLGESASHRAYEEGRKQAYIAQGNNHWVFVGPVDEVARAHHVAIVGERFTWGTQQSSYAERCLQEPRCRHRSVVYRGDGSDTDPKVWQKLKDEAGLYWDSASQKWMMKI